MSFDPKRIAVEYYFGDLQYWKLPAIAADALENGYDGPALRRLAGLADLATGNVRAEDLPANEIDSAFREMSVDAPIAKETAQMILATESAQRAVRGHSNVFDEATHIRVHLCALSEPPEPLRRIVNLSRDAKNAPRSQWGRIEAELKSAFSDFMRSRKTEGPE